MDSREKAIVSFAHDSKDAATGLSSFRDNIPLEAPTINDCISELFAISSILRKLRLDYRDPRFYATFPQIQYNLHLVFRSLKITLDDVFDMFGHSLSQYHEDAWKDLNWRMRVNERMGLLIRLELYHDYLTELSDVLRRRQPQSSKDRRAQLLQLHELQTPQSPLRTNTPAGHGASTPRPPARPPSGHGIDSWVHVNGHTHPSINSSTHPPYAPEVPLSPSYTSGSSDTFASSQQTSYFSTGSSQGPRHWAIEVFNGYNPRSTYDDLQSTKEYESVCKGTDDPKAIDNLTSDGFHKVLKVSFDVDELHVWLYCRPHDQRARMLVITVDNHGDSLYFCQPLTNLKVIRSGTSLQFCRVDREERMMLWARLNFVFHERMVLFHSTFIAMKRQDRRGVDSLLADNFGLDHDNDENDDCEDLLFSGQMQHGEMLHRLALIQDRPSRVVRIEASACRGPYKFVPIWTAFVTKYARNEDIAWAEANRRNEVSLAAMRPKPTVFTHGGFQPPQNTEGHYVLPFTSRQDATNFVEVWTQLCRTFNKRP